MKHRGEFEKQGPPPHMTASIITVPEAHTVVTDQPLSTEAQTTIQIVVPALDPHLTSDQPSELTPSSELLPRTDRVKLRGSLRRD